MLVEGAFGAVRFLAFFDFADIVSSNFVSSASDPLTLLLVAGLCGVVLTKVLPNFVGLLVGQVFQFFDFSNRFLHLRHVHCTCYYFFIVSIYNLQYSR